MINILFYYLKKRFETGREAHRFHTLLFSNILRSSLFDPTFTKEQVTQLPYIVVPLNWDKSVDWESISRACSFPVLSALDYINMNMPLEDVAIVHSIEYQRKYVPSKKKKNEI